MIKKNIHIVLEGSNKEIISDDSFFHSVGDIVHIDTIDVREDLEVIDKSVECKSDHDDKVFDITYTVKKI